jgi:hypothetical protein
MRIAARTATAPDSFRNIGIFRKLGAFTLLLGRFQLFLIIYLLLIKEGPDSGITPWSEPPGVPPIKLLFYIML